MPSTDRWRPPLPSLLRMGGVPVDATFKSRDLLAKCQEYFAERQSVSDIFECRIQPRNLVSAGFSRSEPRYLSEYDAATQCHLLLKNLYFKASDNFKMKLRIALQRKGGLNRVRQWWHTANAVVLPYLLTVGENLDDIDHLTRWTLENCANNYAQFIKDLKSLKKAIRKAFALGRGTRVHRSMRPYYEKFRIIRDFSGPQEWARHVLIWTQTRACGLANGDMIAKSIEKFISTITTPCDRVVMDPTVLSDVIKGAVGVSGTNARISVGTTACLESTRQEGGKSAHLMRLTRVKCIDTEYDFQSLEPRSVTPRPVRSSEDVVHWATHNALTHNAHTRCIRVHAVVEPGKARTITVAPYSYQVLMGVFAHVFQATLRSREVKSGLTKDRHLWRFLSDNMNPQSTLWEHLAPGERVYALSTDWEEATDYGDPYLAKQVWMGFIKLAQHHTNFPTGLACLAMNLYCGKRFVFVPQYGKYRLVTSTRGWFMGDMMTKVILTVVHDYTMRIVGLKVYSIVGDDEIVLSNDRARLTRHLDATRALGVKVSIADTFISHRLAFYCEEGALVPQKPTQALHVKMRRSEEIGYIDYPRFRLLLAESCETDSYSMTNIGRFSLLGKESRWVHAVNRPASQAFRLASVLQHILVPQDSDTLCPFTPIEIGGDGAFTPNHIYMWKIVSKKARDSRETIFRMRSLLNQDFAYRFVRSERYNEVVHKHHLLLPALEEVRKYLPPESIIQPKDDTQRALLESVRIGGIERPQQTWLRLCRGFYWGKIFEGARPLEPSFNVSRKFSDGHTDDVDVDYAAFLRHWVNPGFRFANHDSYFVRRDLVEAADPLTLNWEWSEVDTLRYPSSFAIYSEWMREQEWDSLTDICNLIQRSAPLPDRVVKRLNLYMESDNYILSLLPKEERDEFHIVTRDFRLCAEISRRLGKTRECWVYALDPAAYLTGRYCHEDVRWHSNILRPSQDVTWVEDPGAILHVDYTEFTDGFPHDEGIWDKPLRGLPHGKFPCVVIINMAKF